MNLLPSAGCPCGRLGTSKRPLSFEKCCGPYLADAAGHPAPDAETLMRSRYTAYVLENEVYLRATWHDSMRPPPVDFEPGTKWLGLEVRDHRVIDEDHAEVEFVARYRAAGKGVRLHERSRFTRENGRWYYVDGDIR